MESTELLKIHPRDTVAVALRDCPVGTTCSSEDGELNVRELIPRGHKIALVRIEQGEIVIKYGQPIGIASRKIERGDWVHTHNLQSALSGTLELSYNPPSSVPNTRPSARQSVLTFRGFERADGRVGIRNELWIVPTVGCVNSLAETLALRFREHLLRARRQGGIDDVVAMTHPYGCSQAGKDLERTRRMLAALVRHPNAGGVLVLGLGCEDNTLASFRELLGFPERGPERAPRRVRFLSAQEQGDEIAAGLQALGSLRTYADQFERRAVPISKLRVGLKCGGSDAFSGLTANPLAGACVNRLVALGAGAVMTEVPEIFGAEQLLLNRCASTEIFDKGLDMINRFRRFFMDHGEPIDDNPSPGNREGGITTLEEKSLGCTQKGGSSQVVAVLDYGEEATAAGLSLAEGPGNDLVSVSVLAATGVQLTLFTTGRGTPLGSPVPVIKIASNSSLAEKKRHWIDFDAGTLLEGGSHREAADGLFDLIVQVASGARTANETGRYRHFLPFKTGITE